MKKGICSLVCGAVLLALCSTAAADATEVTDILSGNYSLEYENTTKHQIRRVLTSGDSRIVYRGERQGQTIIWKLDAYVKDSNLYRFEPNGKAQVARVLPLADVADEYLDPSEDWPGVRKKLALPREFSVFGVEDPYGSQPQSIAAPTLDGTEYSSDIMTQAGTVAGRLIDQVVYDQGGKLQRIDEYLEHGGNRQLIESLAIQSLQPLQVSSIDPTGVDIYRANRGDIDDILGKPAKVGSFAAEGGTASENK